MPFPVFFLTLALTTGILFSSFLPLSLKTFVFILIASLCLAWIFYLGKKDRLAFLFIMLSTFLLGANIYSFSHKNYEGNSLRKLKPESYIDFYGTLYKSPSRGYDRDFLFLKVDKVCYKNKEEKMSGNLRVTVLHTSESSSSLKLYTHDKIKVSAKILPQKGFQNFKSDPLSSYIKSQNIHNRAFSKNSLLVEKIESGKKFSALRSISIIRQKLQAKIEEHFSASNESKLSPQGAVLEALLLGERRRMDPLITQSLQEAGLYHLFAISGAHIAIISFLLFLLLRLLRVATRLSYLLMMAFLVFYAFLVEGRPSVLRATIMTLAYLLGKLIWKNVSLINTISISAFFLLLVNPFSLFNLGFQLTFAATFSIILFFPLIIKYLPRLPLKISEILTLSLTAKLGTLPFMVTSFNRVTFSSLLLNFAAIPLVGLIMALGFIFLPLSLISPALAQWLTKGIKILINLLISCSHLFDKFSFCSYRIPTPSLFLVIGYFLFLTLLLVPSKIKRQKSILLLCFLLFLVILISSPFPSISKDLKFTFIDVGQGESILIEFPGRKKMLVDGGGLPVGTFDIGENVVSPFLWRKGIKTINYLVLTHAHPDHLNGLKAIGKNFKIGEYWEAYSPAENSHYAEFKKLLPSSVVSKRMFRGTTHQEGAVKIEVLHPVKAKPLVHTVHNDQSLVLRFICGQISVLLTGDIGIRAEKEILEHSKNIKSQVFKSPHHGSASSSSREILESVLPEIIVISAGTGNIFGFPNHETLERYKEIRAKVYRTDIHGAIEITTDGRSIAVRTAGDVPQSTTLDSQ